MKTYHGWCGKYNTRKAILRNKIIYGVSDIEPYLQLARMLRRIITGSLSSWKYVERN